jgi:hypothetical protein
MGMRAAAAWAGCSRLQVHGCTLWLKLVGMDELCLADCPAASGAGCMRTSLALCCCYGMEQKRLRLVWCQHLGCTFIRVIRVYCSWALLQLIHFFNLGAWTAVGSMGPWVASVPGSEARHLVTKTAASSIVVVPMSSRC